MATKNAPGDTAPRSWPAPRPGCDGWRPPTPAADGAGGPYGAGRHRVVRARRRRTAVVAAPMVVALIAGAVSLATGLRDGRSADTGHHTGHHAHPGPDRDAPEGAGAAGRGGRHGPAGVRAGRLAGAEAAPRGRHGRRRRSGERDVRPVGPGDARDVGTRRRPARRRARRPPRRGARRRPPSRRDTGDSACGDALKEALDGPELCLPVTRLGKNSALVLWRRESYDRPRAEAARAAVAPDPDLPGAGRARPSSACGSRCPATPTARSPRTPASPPRTPP